MGHADDHPAADGAHTRSQASQHCDLCEAAPITTWYHEDAVCWIADCEICQVPMVVWRSHGAEPPADALSHMLDRLRAIADARFGVDGWFLDREMRRIPDHFHAHARDPDWWSRIAARFLRP